jgi:hypothetical protein
MHNSLLYSNPNVVIQVSSFWVGRDISLEMREAQDIDNE